MSTQKQPKVLAVIPARGGSKGLPRKNVLPLAGKPLLAYSIDAALGSRRLDRTLVSTEDPEITEVARQYGADVPFLRPPELAMDDSSPYAVLTHALGWLEGHEGYRPEYVLLLQPTSPLRTSKDIDNCVELAVEKNADGVVSLCEVKHHPHHTKCVGKDGEIASFIPVDGVSNRRQGVPPVYCPNGALYLGRRELVLEHETVYSDRTYAYVMPPERSLDIDTAWDLHLAEMIIEDVNRHERD